MPFLLVAGLLIVGLLVSGCDMTTLDEPVPVVVEAFVETDQPPPPVRVRAVQSLRSNAPDGISDAEVRLTIGGRAVAYRPDASEAGRYVPTGSADTVRSGTRFNLEVSHADGVARGQGRTPPRIRLDSVVTTVPDAPVEAVSVDSLRRDSLDIPATTNFIYPIEVEVYWTAPPADSHWVRTALRPENQPFSPRIVDFFIQPEAVFLESSRAVSDSNAVVRRWSGVYAIPVETSTDALPTHRLLVLAVRGDADYASFTAERDDPDRREPPSNVTGALGIVTGVAVDSITVAIP